MCDHFFKVLIEDFFILFLKLVTEVGVPWCKYFQVILESVYFGDGMVAFYAPLICEGFL